MNIFEKRKAIYEILIDEGFNPFFEKLNSKDLYFIFELYDKYFFENTITRKLKSTKSFLSFGITSGKKFGPAGTCTLKGCEYIISFPLNIYLELFPNKKGKLTTNGIDCIDRLSCLQLTFEHELCHLLMYLYNYYKYGDSIFGDHGKLFMCFANTVFGHTGFKHLLVSGIEEITFLRNFDFSVGMVVYFRDLKRNMDYKGTIFKVNPRRLILVDVTNITTNQNLPNGVRVPKEIIYKAEKEKRVIKSTLSEPSKHFSVGMVVRFRDEKRDMNFEGTVIKVNPKNLIVDNVINLNSNEKIDKKLFVNKDIVYFKKEGQPIKQPEYNIGNKVSFDYKGERYMGVITKINPSTIQVKNTYNIKTGKEFLNFKISKFSKDVKIEF